MIVRDPLYGEITVQDSTETLIQTPEVRRLSQIRLLNTLSPSLATLGELRRYSHTLGVLHLSRMASRRGWLDRERTAFEAAVLLHDIGTPPFGHLVEYVYRELGALGHEGIVPRVLWGHHAPENRAHQIFAGRTIEFRRAVQKAGLDLSTIEAIVARTHPLSALLFGTLDFDNIDNVLRMAWALGITREIEWAAELSSALAVDPHGRLLLSEHALRGAVQQWADLRRRCYSIVVFDPSTVAAQAVLTVAVEAAVVSKELTLDDWFLTDEMLLQRLLESPATKNLISQEYLGRLPRPVLCLQVRGSLSELGFDTRRAAACVIEQAIHEVLGDIRGLGYAFEDRGSFEKQLRFVDPGTSEEWCFGATSRSVVLYGFTRLGTRLTSDRCVAACRNLIRRLGCNDDQIVQAYGSEWQTADAKLALD